MARQLKGVADPPSLLWRQQNRDRLNCRKRAAYHANPTRTIDNNLRRVYGISIAERISLMNAQGRRCAICGTSDSGTKRSFHVDHCHTSGKVRGILCHGCNLGLAGFKNDPERLRGAIDYLARNGGVIHA